MLQKWTVKQDEFSVKRVVALTGVGTVLLFTIVLGVASR